MSHEFDSENKANWKASLAAAFPTGIPKSASWTDLNAIISILSKFCAQDLNHAMLPCGGGIDVVNLAPSKETGCIELQNSSEVAYVCQPHTLSFEHISGSPVNSFFVLSTQEIQPSGVYHEMSGQYEELLELPDGEYRNRSALDEGHLGYDKSDAEIPIPDPHRLIIRFLSGAFLIVAKRSLWNRTTATYDGRHAEMTPIQIRQQIESALR